MAIGGSVRRVAVGLVAAVLIGASPAPSALAATPSFAPSPAAYTGQFRAYWVDAFGEGIRTPAEIDAVIAATKAINANAIIAQVVRRGDCFCNDNSFAPRTEDPAVDPFPYDPLQMLITKAHANLLEVHAWVITTAIWRGSTPPAAANHVFNQHGPTKAASDAANWLDVRWDGARQTANGDWYLDPGHPDAAKWVVDVATELVRDYDIDGINLDRIRYPDENFWGEPSWGYNATAEKHFWSETGRADIPLRTDAQWTQWRRDQVTNIVRRIYVESYAIKPSVRVSADTITYGYGPQHGSGFTGTRTYREVLQDWDGWMREGILDTNILMNYKREADQDPTAQQATMYREWADFAKDHQYGRQSVIGAALYLNSVVGSHDQVIVAIQPSPWPLLNVGAGWAGYSYRTPDHRADEGSRSPADSRTALTAELVNEFTSTTLVATMPWKTSPTTGHVRGTTTPGALVRLADNATGVPLRAQFADGTGWFGFVDVTPGLYRVTANGVPIGSVEVLAGEAPQVTPSVCTSSAAPAATPPASVPSGIAGYHAAWYGQSGYMTLCPGEFAHVTFAYYNSGSAGWLRVMGHVAYLGTWNPVPGQDQPSAIGGDGQGSPNTGWPRYNRPAVQAHEWVGPGQVAWFLFTVRAPPTPGTYRLYIRPLIEGTTWMEDYGAYWQLTVR